ncbi:50S ribosomal protein L15, partial [Sphaeroforma arctica JP610]
KAKRLGRGSGGGKAKTSGRGHKGQGKYGTGKGPHFEGGQKPLHKTIPKWGMTTFKRKEYETVNLNKLQTWIDQGRLDTSGVITMKTLRDCGLASRSLKGGVKILGEKEGELKFNTPIEIEVSQASRTAIRDIEASGGKVTAKYFNTASLRALIKPHKFPNGVPKAPLPVVSKTLKWYRNYDNRGYLATKPEDESATGAATTYKVTELKEVKA